MNELMQKLLRLKTSAKIGITLGAIAAIGLIYNTLFYSDLSDGIKNAETRQEQLKTEREGYERRKREYLAYRNELTQLQEEQRELLKALPAKPDIPAFMTAVNEQMELSGLEPITQVFEAEIADELYIKIPVRMEVRGTFHGLTKFFKNLSEIRRIVNIENLAVQVEKTNGIEGQVQGPPKVRARFVAATFRYNDTKTGGSP